MNTIFNLIREVLYVCPGFRNILIWGGSKMKFCIWCSHNIVKTVIPTASPFLTAIGSDLTWHILCCCCLHWLNFSATKKLHPYANKEKTWRDLFRYFGSSDNLAANSSEANTSAIIHSAAVHLYQLYSHRKKFVIRRPWNREKWLDADSDRHF